MMPNIIGYQGICSESGKYVPAEDAFTYALDNIWANAGLIADSVGMDDKEVVEWFYSGNFIEICEELGNGKYHYCEEEKEQN